MAREIAATATWRRLLFDPASGALLDHGRTTYTPPVALADFVKARDVHCRFPGCRRAVVNGELDHVHAYADGGVDQRGRTWPGTACATTTSNTPAAAGRSAPCPTGSGMDHPDRAHPHVTRPYDYRGDPDPP